MSEGRGLDEELLAGRFPVHRACREGDVGALVALVQQLADPEHLTAEDSSYGWSPLHWAAHCGQVGSSGPGQGSGLDCVVVLVQMGCGVNSGTSRFNQTATHTAAFGGHPACVAWLTGAGADANRQDLVGEAPLHKAARAGSLECIRVLLLAGASAQLRNASGQTAADLALAHGFLDCFSFISRTSKLQLGGPGPPGRKRPLTPGDQVHLKKARGADNVEAAGGEEPESMSVEPDSAAAVGPHREDPRSPAPSSLPANRQAARRPSADMCGALHLSSSCVRERPARRLGLLYGHYHGFGDTAEELGDLDQDS
ncbi:Ankyrin repeat domain-containing protein 10 [Liparis tanakae]|uniref:Ankyrin repeat domain-containing protein 10 n=1 Tax=Liparis tanakae TaxID=230148 RepID=A0A4Z2FPY5_9TELE|nr:Ankyrin repeat domain-containing protein 10 [Liparis tanakae]